MAKNNKAAVGGEQKLQTLEELQRVHGTDPATFAGAMAVNGWRAGKLLSGDEYLAGIRRFTDRPAGRGKEV